MTYPRVCTRKKKPGSDISSIREVKKKKPGQCPVPEETSPSQSIPSKFIAHSSPPAHPPRLLLSQTLYTLHPTMFKRYKILSPFKLIDTLINYCYHRTAGLLDLLPEGGSAPISGRLNSAMPSRPPGPPFLFSGLATWPPRPQRSERSTRLSVLSLTWCVPLFCSFRFGRLVGWQRGLTLP